MKSAFLCKTEHWLRLNLLLFLVFIPFNTKKFFYSFTGRIEDFLSVFLYASDIFLFLFLIIFLMAVRRWPGEDLKLNKIIFIFLILFLAAAGLSIFWSEYPLAAFYRFTRLLMFAAGALAMAVVLKKKIVDLRSIAAVLAGSAVFQSFVVLYQFIFGHSAGLWWLGEPAISVFGPGAARFVVNGELVLRGFGTLPHANILAAFMVLGLVCLFYLWLVPLEVSPALARPKGHWGRLLLTGFGIFAVLTSLLVSFSRSGWLGFLFAALLTVVAGLADKKWRLATLSLLLLLGVLTGVLTTYFSGFVFARARFPAGDASIVQRQDFNRIGLNMLKTYPLGVGLANQVFFAGDHGLYGQFNVIKKTDWQPIHNLYFLIGSEIGWLGLTLFLIFLFFVFKKAVLNLRAFLSPEIFFPLIMFLTLLALGLVDHYFWDLQSGMLMFWLVLGIMISVSPRSSMDRIPASEAGDGSSTLPEDAK